MLSQLSSHAASLVEVVAVAAGGPIVALAKLPDASASLHHHHLWHRHHNTKEVWILKRLEVRKTGTFCFYIYYMIEKVVIRSKTEVNEEKNVLRMQAGRRQTARSQAAV